MTNTAAASRTFLPGSTPRMTERRGSTLILVLFVLAIATLLIIPLQLSAYRQAASGREALGQVRARWAARAGVERYIGFLGWQIENEQDDTDLVKFQNDMQNLARADLSDSSGIVVAGYHVQHYDFDSRRNVDGPMDAHSKLNINLLTEDSLARIPDMTQTLSAAILDWIDTDDDVREGGAESSFYNNPLSPYKPRNGPMKTLDELTMVLDVTPLLVWGEDTNENNVFDPNENDGDKTLPEDNQDGYLDAGWSEYLTTASSEPGPYSPNSRKLDLSTSASRDIQSALGVDSNQAAALFAFSRVQTTTMASLLTTPLSTIGRNGQPGSNPNIGAKDLTDDQLAAVFNGAAMGTLKATQPGKLNLNTAPLDVIKILPQIDENMAEEIYQARRASTLGYQSVTDLLHLPNMTREMLAALVPLVDVHSNVFVITSVGIAQPADSRVELRVTIDRSSLPIQITEYFER